MEPLYTERNKVEGTNAGSFWVPSGRYQEGQVLNALPEGAVRLDDDMKPYKKLSELLELYKPQNIQEIRKALNKWQYFLQPEEVRLIDNLLMYLEQSKI